MASRPLNESFETSGEWFLPEAPDHVIAGTLHYTPRQTELHLHEPFQPLHGTLHIGASQPSYPVIHGITREGLAVTLLSSRRIGISLNFGSGGFRQPERLSSFRLLIGAHLSPDFLFHEMRFRIPGLQVWLSRKVISSTLEQNEQTKQLTLSYRIQRPGQETIRVHSIGADLDWGISFNTNDNPFTSIAVNVSGWLTIRPSTPQTLDWHLEQHGKATTMLALLAGTSMSPDLIETSIDNDPHHSIDVKVALQDAKYCAYTSPP